MLSEIEGSRGITFWGAHAPPRAGDGALAIANFLPITHFGEGRRNVHARARALPGLSAKSIQPCYIASDDQRVNVVCAFIRENAF